MVERFLLVEDHLLAVTNDGRLYGAPLRTLRWEHILVGTDGVQAVAQQRTG